MEGEGPHVESLVPADDAPPEIIKDSGKGRNDFIVNVGFDSRILGKVEGQPAPGKPDDALREAYLAYDLARRPEVQHVLLGEAAVKFLYGRAKHEKEQDVDVIALLNRTDVIIGDSKGVHFGKALVQQLPHSAQALNAKGFQVVEGIVLARQPKTIIASLPTDPGWRLVGVPHPSIDAAGLASADPKHPYDPKFIYLLDQDFHSVHNPSGLAIEPHTKSPWLQTHIDAPLLDHRGHMQPGVWSYMRPFIIPTTVAKVKLAFVRR
jgi:hypothetical protein